MRKTREVRGGVKEEVMGGIRGGVREEVRRMGGIKEVRGGVREVIKGKNKKTQTSFLGLILITFIIIFFTIIYLTLPFLFGKSKTILDKNAEIIDDNLALYLHSLAILSNLTEEDKQWLKEEWLKENGYELGYELDFTYELPYLALYDEKQHSVASIQMNKKFFGHYLPLPIKIEKANINEIEKLENEKSVRAVILLPYSEEKFLKVIVKLD